MSERDDIRDIHLSALVDGELSDGRRAELEQAMKADASLAARFAEMRTEKEMLRRIFDPVAHRPIPQEWLARAYRPQPQVSWRALAAIAAVLLAAVFATFSYLGQRTPAVAGIVDEALNARLDVTSPQKVIAVTQGASLADYDGILKGVVGARVRVPDMRRAGYRLASIRLYPHDGASAAQLSYRDTQNHVFTLYVSHSDGTVDFVQFPRRGLRVCLWRDDQVSTVMAGNISTAVMQRLAVLAYAGLTA